MTVITPLDVLVRAGTDAPAATERPLELPLLMQSTEVEHEVCAHTGAAPTRTPPSAVPNKTTERKRGRRAARTASCF